VKRKKPIAHEDTISFEEELPLPWVYYPSAGIGAFFAYSAENSGELFLCSCSKVAVENYIVLRIRDRLERFAYPKYNFILSGKKFPELLVQRLLEQKVPSDESAINYLNFKDNICYECRKIIPKYRFTHEMYGGVFKQNYGWFILKEGYTYGIDYNLIRVAQDRVPEELQPIMLPELNELSDLLARDLHPENFAGQDIKWKDVHEYARILRTTIENKARSEFGFKKVGEAWTAETLLYYLVKELYPSLEILRHYRADFLQRLELDVYIPEMQLGIEYQGQQHYSPVKHWGGDEAFTKLVERDSLKKKLCKENGIKLLYVKFDEPITKEHISSKIKAIIQLNQL
jgi:hypothetical protein